MVRAVLLAAVVLLLVLMMAGCGRDGTMSALPPGSIEAGRTAFADLQCHNCHRIDGEDFPSARIDPAIKLGGTVLVKPATHELVRDLTLPSSRFAMGYPTTQILQEGRSRMPDFTRRMTVRQLSDLVAFLDAKYVEGVASRPML